MIFESLQIADFGKLSNVRLDFSGGVNIIEGLNESGKSTVGAFLQFMFYGLSGRADEKLRYISWKSARAAGSLTFSDGDRRYRIERETICSAGSDTKTTLRDRCTVYDADSNQPVYKGQNPGDIFFGVSSAVFENTAYIRQTADTKVGGHDLGEEAENILFSGNESINTAKAVEKLDSARVYLLHKNRHGGKIAELEAARDELEPRLTAAMAAGGDIIYLEGTQRQLTEKRAAAEERLATVDAELSQYEKYNIKKAYQRRKSEKARLADTEAQIAALRAAPEHGGIDISAPAYVTALENNRHELSLAQSKYEDAEKELASADDKLNDLSEKLAIFERFGSRGGGKNRAELIERVRGFEEKRRRHRRLSVCFFILALALLAFAVLVYMLIPEHGPLFYASAAAVPVSLVLALIFLFRARAYNSAVREICTRFSCKSFAEFEEMVRAASEDEAYMLFVTTARDEAEDRFNEASARLDRLSNEILAALSKDGFQISGNTDASLADAITACREAQTALAKFETAGDEQKRRINEIEETLTAYPKEYLRDACLTEYDEETMEAFNLTAKKRDRDFLSGSVTAMTEKIHKIEVDLSALLATSVQPTELAEEKAALDEQIHTLTEKWNAYMLAIESLGAAGGKLREGISPKIAKSAGKLMNAMTDGKYTDIGVDTDFGLSFSDGTAMHDASSLSAGTGDMAYICLRIALIELLYQKSVPPLIFDESFVRMDDGRLSKVLTLISKYADRGMQSILFTCHSRERTLMESLGTCKVHPI